LGNETHVTYVDFQAFPDPFENLCNHHRCEVHRDPYYQLKEDVEAAEEFQA
jgi:hypothetical protein